ncbi:MAG: hypothetical protein IKT27_02960 [Clostridia bacterium]|nr:hypothetical protein [Clostridia bacterium]
MALTSKEKTPCYSYQERDNADTDTGNTLGYSRISFTVKVWSSDIAQLQHYALEADRVLRPLGFKRVSSNELADRNSTMIQKILTYEALGLENY